jgi:CheY-like chemotaxis protein
MARKKILFVDDNMMDRMILSKILDELDIDYYDTKTPEEFLKQLKEVSPDMCLIDLNIKQVNDGQVLVQAIRNILGEDLPIIIISASEKSEMIKKIIKIGANDYVCKPIDKSLLSSKISNYFKSRRINSFVLPLFIVPGGEKSKSTIQFNCKIEKVSELGIQFSSTHVLHEKTKLQISDPYMYEIFDEHGTVKFVVNESWEDDTDDSKHFFAKYDLLSSKQKQKLRAFITTQQNKK